MSEAMSFKQRKVEQEADSDDDGLFSLPPSIVPRLLTPNTLERATRSVVEWFSNGCELARRFDRGEA